MSLSYDTARCHGVNVDGEWREGCETCMRRTSPGRAECQAYIAPPSFIVFECEYRIEPNIFECISCYPKLCSCKKGGAA